MKLSLYHLVTFILLLFLLPSCKVLSQNSPGMVKKIHHQAIVIDTHTDTPMMLLNNGFNVAVRHTAPDSRVDFPRLREGDVDAIFFGLFTSQRQRTPENYNEAYQLACRMLDSTVTAIERNNFAAELATSARDVTRISKKNKTAICLGMENGFPLSKDIPRIQEFYQKGVRYITLCHTTNNDICDSSTDPEGAENNGLSSFGHEVVAEMNRLGMIVDVSHISDKSFYDVLAASKAPVIASHSSVRSLCNVPRNMSDDMIRALAKNGGVIQICILGSYIVPDDTASENYLKRKEIRKKYGSFPYRNEETRRAAWKARDSVDRYFPPVLPTIAQAVDHIDYVVKLVGIDYVGIGSDFDGGGGLADCRDVADFPKITDELIRRGYSSSDIAKIWGGNFLRVFRSAEKVAKHM